MSLQIDVETLVAAGAAASRDDARETFARLREALSSGAVRAAEPDNASGIGWQLPLASLICFRRSPYWAEVMR